MRDASASTGAPRSASRRATCSATKSARAARSAACSPAGSAGPLPRFLVGESEDGQRLDTVLAALVGESRSQVRRWIDEGRVRWNGRSVAASQLVSDGDWIDAEPPEP